MNHFQHIDFNRISEEDLLDFIEGKHHNYALDMLSLLEKNLVAALSLRNGKTPFLEEVLRKIKHLHFLTQTLITHKQSSLFPFIRRLRLSYNKANERFLLVPLVKSSMRSLDKQQNDILEELRHLRELIDEHSKHNTINEITRLCFAELDEFEHDFSNGLNREKEFLLPRLLILEEQVRLLSMKSNSISPGPGKDA